MRHPEQEVIIDYTNWRGVRSIRRIHPLSVRFEATEWHQYPQWILRAVDTEKGETRDFAMSEIRTWAPAEEVRVSNPPH